MNTNQEKRKYLLERLKPLLKEEGFKKKSFTFHRTTENGVTQVIELALSNCAFSANSSTLMPEYAIYFEELNKCLSFLGRPKLIRTCDCRFRDFGCWFGNKPPVFQPDLPDDPETIFPALRSLVMENYVPMLNKSKTRRELYNLFESEYPKLLDLWVPHQVNFAFVMYADNDYDEAVRLIEQACNNVEGKRYPQYKEFRKNIIERDPERWARAEIERRNKLIQAATS